jgi:aspartokinase
MLPMPEVPELKGQSEEEEPEDTDAGLAAEETLDDAARAALSVPRVDIEDPPGVTAAFSDGGFAQLVIDCSNLKRTSLNRADVYDVLAKEGISATLPQLYGDQISLVIRSDDAARAGEAIEHELDIQSTVRDGLSLVTARAVDMRALTGVMSRARAALLEAGVDPIQVGDSHASLFVLVPEDQAAAAVAAWRREFQIDEVPHG